MENRQQQILAEIQELMSSVRSQLEKLDAKMQEFQQCTDPQGDAFAPIDIEIDESYLEKEVVVETDLDFEVAQEPEPQPVSIEVSEPEIISQPEPVFEPVVIMEPEPEQIAEPIYEPQPEPAPLPAMFPEGDDDDLPLFAEPESIFEAAQKSPRARKAMIDVMEDKQTWRTDMPGAPVKDILSAISLNDRVQFINVLFNEDPALFQQTRARINTLETLDQALDYITSTFNWDMNSQVVYRFMMAVRRKVR